MGVVTIVVTKDEHKFIREQAKIKKVSINKFVRLMLFDYEKEADDDEIKLKTEIEAKNKGIEVMSEDPLDYNNV